LALISCGYTLLPIWWTSSGSPTPYGGLHGDVSPFTRQKMVHFKIRSVSD
jgi:hypothetical protein